MIGVRNALLRRSLLRRLTTFYAIFVSIALFTFASAATVVVFENLTRGDVMMLETAYREILATVAEAPVREPTTTLLHEIAESAHREGVQVLPVQLDSRKQFARQPPWDLSVGQLFGLNPFFAPVRDSTVIILPDPRRLNRSLQGFLVTLVILAVVSVAAGWLIARLIARQTIRPLLTVTAELRRFESGDFSPRTMMETDLTELGDLAAAYNGAARQVTNALQERQRVEEQIRQFVAEAGHELRTPLTVVAGYVDVLRRGGDMNPRVRAISFESLGFELKRMRMLVERLMTLARLDRPLEANDEVIDVRAMVGQAVDAIAVTSDVSIRFAPHGDFFVRGEAGDVYEATANLLENAVKYGEGSDVNVALEMSGRNVVVRIRDGGPGIAEPHQKRIFERFYRATERSEIAGSGLGLAIAARAAERLNGRLELQDARPKSTTFALIVPSLQENGLARARNIRV